MLLGISLVAGLLLGPSADVEPEEELARRIDALVQAREYDKALELLDVADTLRPNANWLYMRGGVLVLMGDCDAAIKTYREYFGRGPTSKEAATEAQEKLDACQDTIGAEAPTQPSPPPEPEPPPPTTTSPPAQPDDVPPPRESTPGSQRRRWYQDPAGAVLLAGGVATASVGLGLALRARQDERAAGAASNLDGYDDRIRKAARLSRAGLSLGVIGAALIAGAIIRYVVVGVRARRQRAPQLTSHSESSPWRVSPGGLRFPPLRGQHRGSLRFGR